MREMLEAVSAELKRLRWEGVDAVYVTEETLARLRLAARSQAPAPAAAQVPSAHDLVQARSFEGVQQEAKAALAAEYTGGPISIPSATAGPVRRAPEPAVVVAASPTADVPPPTPFTLPAGSQQEQWNWLKDKVLNDPVCRAHVRPGKHVVLGIGSLEADIFFCGEAPGAEEETQGEPFVGPAGQLLTRMIQAMGLKRDQVYIGNIMNWRPEMDSEFGNRPPSEQEMAYCLPHLRKQLEIIKPKVIVALGGTAIKGLLGADMAIGKARGKWHEWAGIPLMPTFHPSYLLRNNTMKTKRQVWEDLMLVMERIGLPISSKQRGYFTEPPQG